MARELKDILASIKEAKRKRLFIKKSLKAELEQSKAYQETVEQIQKLKAKKAQIEAAVRQSMEEDIVKSEQLSVFIKNESELLSDTAMSKYLKGENIEVKDDNDVKYEPRFTVRFKKR